MEFLLDSASSYAPTDTVSLENVMFLFQLSPGSEKIVVHGFDRIGKALFAVYAILGDGNEVLVEGTSSQTASSGTALLIETLVTFIFLLKSVDLCVYVNPPTRCNTLKQIL